MLIISLKINVIRQFQYKKALFNHYGQQYMVASAPLVRTLSAPAAIEETEASHRLFALHGRCQGSNRFGSMGVEVARLLRG